MGFSRFSVSDSSGYAAAPASALVDGLAAALGGVAGQRRVALVAAALGLLGAGEDLVDEAVVLGLLRGEPAVAVGVALDLVEVLPRVLGDELGHLLLDVEHLLGLDLDVAGGTADAAGRLVHHHAGVRRRVALAGSTGAEEE